MTPYDVLEVARNLGLHVSVVDEKNVRVVGPKKNITEALRDYITQYKPEIIELLARHGSKVPESFREQACQRCGSHEAIQRDDGLWVCPCYFTWQPEAVEPAQTKAVRILWDRPKVNERGLDNTCSQCSRDAVWYGTGRIAYCNSCWTGNRHEEGNNID